jgi:hypothetical protein
MLPHKDVDFKPPKNRIPSFVANKDIRAANEFKINDGNVANAVQIKRIEAPKVNVYFRLAVKYTSVLEAARAVDSMRRAEQTPTPISSLMSWNLSLLTLQSCPPTSATLRHLP